MCPPTHFDQPRDTRKQGGEGSIEERRVVRYTHKKSVRRFGFLLSLTFFLLPPRPPLYIYALHLYIWMTASDEADAVLSTLDSRVRTSILAYGFNCACLLDPLLPLMMMLAASYCRIILTYT